MPKKKNKIPLDPAIKKIQKLLKIPNALEELNERLDEAKKLLKEGKIPESLSLAQEAMDHYCRRLDNIDPLPNNLISN